jgi:ADP-heptose:LPS heptosyltransferase
MIIADYKYGRLGNNLELAAHLIAFSILYKKEVSLNYLRDAKDNFPYFIDNGLLIYPERRVPKTLAILYLKAFQIAKRLGFIKEVDYLKDNKWEFFNEESSDKKLLRNLLNEKIVFFKGWRFRKRCLSEYDKNEIRRVFKPSKSIEDRSKNLRLLLNADTVVGIHIRWGDLKELNPSHCLPLDSYFSLMEKIHKDLLPKKVGFIVCSEEKDLEGLSGYNHVHSGGSPIEDIYALAEADLIVSNGSTFANWASFYGNKPLLNIFNNIGDPISALEPYNWQFQQLL